MASVFGLLLAPEAGNKSLPCSAGPRLLCEIVSEARNRSTQAAFHFVFISHFSIFTNLGREPGYPVPGMVSGAGNTARGKTKKKQSRLVELSGKAGDKEIDRCVTRCMTYLSGVSRMEREEQLREEPVCLGWWWRPWRALHQPPKRRPPRPDPRICEYVALYGRRNFAGVVKGLKIKRLPWIIWVGAL